MRPTRTSPRKQPARAAGVFRNRPTAGRERPEYSPEGTALAADRTYPPQTKKPSVWLGYERKKSWPGGVASDQAELSARDPYETAESDMMLHCHYRLKLANTRATIRNRRKTWRKQKSPAQWPGFVWGATSQRGKRVPKVAHECQAGPLTV